MLGEIAFGLLMLAAPVALAVADAFLVTRGAAAAAPVLWSSLALFLAVVIVLGRGLEAEAPFLAGAGSAAGAVGLLAAATHAGIERVRAIVLDGIAPDQLLAVQRALDASDFVRAALPASLLFPAGLVLLVIALQRAHRIRRAAASALILGAVLFPVARITASIFVLVPADLALLVGFSSLVLPELHRHRHHAAETSFA